MTHSKGISWIDDCRIPFEDTQNPATNPKYRLEGGYKLAEKGKISDGSITQFRSSLNETDTRGRFPANLLVSDDMLNDGVITKVQDNLKEKTKQYKGGNFGGGSVKNNFYFGDKGTNSRYYDIDKWFDKIINYE
jgi:hypothetical protein